MKIMISACDDNKTGAIEMDDFIKAILD